MEHNRDFALSHTFQIEAGYAERDTEGGGAVNRGITFTTFKAWRSLKGQLSVTWDDLKAMTQEEATQIYNAQYLAPISFDKLPSGVDYVVLDCSIIGGVAGAVKILQKALGFKGKQVDGHLGLSTLWGVKQRDKVKLINAISDKRLEVYPTFGNYKKVAVKKTGKTWGKIWTERVAKVRKAALGLVGAGPVL